MVEFQDDCGLQIIKDLVEGDPNLSRIYGFILYTKAHPYVTKVLRDDDFWNEFNYVSGSSWPIFAVRPLQQGSLKKNWKEPKDNLQILRDFGLENSQELPLFVVFMWDDHENLNEITVPIRGNDVNAVHNSLRCIIETITNVEQAVLPEYKRSEKVFQNVKTELESQENKTRAINWGKIITRFSEFFLLFCQ